MNKTKPIIAVGIIGAFAAHEVLYHGQDKLTHLPEGEPAPVLKQRLVTFVTSAQSMPQKAREFLAQFVTQTGSGTIFPLA